MIELVLAAGAVAGALVAVGFVLGFALAARLADSVLDIEVERRANAWRSPAVEGARGGGQAVMESLLRWGAEQ